MNAMKNLKTAGLLCAALFLLVMSGNSQTKEDVIKAFNQGAASIKTKEYVKVVESFQQVIDLGTKVGAESDSIRKIAEGNIASFQKQLAFVVYQDKASTSADILASFQKAKDLADKYGDTTTSAQVGGIITKLYTNMAMVAFKANDLPKALAYFDKVISLEPNNTQAYFNKAIIYKKQNVFDTMLQSLTKSIELATKSSDTATVRKAKAILETEYMNLANAAFVKKDYKGALIPLEEALKYNDKDAQVYYMQAFSKNKLKDYDGALEVVTKGLQFENPAKEKLARFYYEQGLAYKAKGDKDKALESFKLAKFGTFVLPATSQIKDLTKPAIPAK